MSLAGLLSGAGVRVEIRSALTPPIVLGGVGSAAGAAAGGAAPGEPVRSRFDPLRLVKPAITVDAGGVRVAEWKPHGEPSRFGPVVSALAIVGALSGLVLLGYAVGRLERRGQ